MANLWQRLLFDEDLTESTRVGVECRYPAFPLGAVFRSIRCKTAVANMIAGAMRMEPLEFNSGLCLTSFNSRFISSISGTNNLFWVLPEETPMLAIRPAGTRPGVVLFVTTLSRPPVNATAITFRKSVQEHLREEAAILESFENAYHWGASEDFGLYMVLAADMPISIDSRGRACSASGVGRALFTQLFRGVE